MFFPPRLKEFGNEPGPAGLMRSADAAAVVAVEILVKEHVIAEMRIGLQFVAIAEDGSPTGFIPQEEPR